MCIYTVYMNTVYRLYEYNIRSNLYTNCLQYYVEYSCKAI